MSEEAIAFRGSPVQKITVQLSGFSKYIMKLPKSFWCVRTHQRCDNSADLVVEGVAFAAEAVLDPVHELLNGGRVLPLQPRRVQRRPPLLIVPPVLLQPYQVLLSPANARLCALNRDKIKHLPKLHSI